MPPSANATLRPIPGPLFLLLAALSAPAHAADMPPESAPIIVTAQRRAQNIDAVPLSVTVADSETLDAARVRSVADLRALSPATRFDVGNFPAASANIIIRGLGTAGQNRSFEGSVGVFIDGVYRSRAAAALQSFLDIDRLEILKGPQGTLFGKNTTAGAILLASTRPDPDAYAGMASLDLGNYNSLTARGSVNLPLGANAALRIAGLASRADNFFTNPTTRTRYDGDRTGAVKGQLLFAPAPDLSIHLIADYSDTDSICCYLSNDYADGPDEPVVRQLAAAAGTVPAAPAGTLRFARTLNTQGRGRIRDYGATLRVELAALGGTFSSTTAWREFRTRHADMDGDLSGADIERYSENFQSRFLSQELTFRTTFAAPGTRRPADLLAGLYVSDEKLTMGNALGWGTQAQAYWDAVAGPGVTYAAPGIWADNAMAGSARSLAAFAHLEMPLGAKVGLVAGARYTIEKKRGDYRNLFYRPEANDVLRLFGVMPGPDYDDQRTDRALSGTLGLNYQPTDTLLLYASFNRGFKAGGVNIDGNAAGGRLDNPAEVPGATPLSPLYQPERVDAIEAGLKWHTPRARTELAIFHYRLKNVQIAQFIGLQFAVLNARAATDWGVELAQSLTLVPGVTLDLDGQWLPRARYAADPQLPPALSGARFRFAPKFAGNAMLAVEQRLSARTTLHARLQYQYTSPEFVNTASDTQRGALHLIDGSLGLTFPDTGLAVDLWAKNLTNRRYITQAFDTPVQAADENVYLGAPRTFGLKLTARF